jgi:hypothetical protein
MDAEWGGNGELMQQTIQAGDKVNVPPFGVGLYQNK